MSFTNDPALQINQLPISLELPKDPEELREVLDLFIKRISNTVQTKVGGLYSANEYFNSKQFNVTSSMSFKNVYSKTFDMVSLNSGPITAGTTVSVAHNITGITQTTQVYGSATNSDSPVKYIPLPYVSATLVTDQVQIYLTPTNVILINGSTQSTLTSATITGEYLKN